jgi:hypothetical protein
VLKFIKMTLVSFIKAKVVDKLTKVLNFDGHSFVMDQQKLILTVLSRFCSYFMVNSSRILMQ